MKRINKFLGTPGVTLALFVLAAVLLLTSTIGGTTAALANFSNVYTAQIEMHNIGVTLLEDGTAVASRDFVPNSNAQWSGNVEGTLLGGEWLKKNNLRGEENPEGEPLKLGYSYPYELSVRNSGTIHEYVRVTVYKYWMTPDKNGKLVKDTTVDPDLIELEWNTGSGWTVDESASTPERTVLYYEPLVAAGTDTAPLTRSLTISEDLGLKVREEQNGNVVTILYAYDGAKFMIEATVDAVQEHNAADAKRAVWGTVGP